jgi:hypothetical protein
VTRFQVEVLEGRKWIVVPSDAPHVTDEPAIAEAKRLFLERCRETRVRRVVEKTVFQSVKPVRVAA